MRRIHLGLAAILLAASPLVAGAQTTCPNGECGPADGETVVSNGGQSGRSGSLIARLRERCQSGECLPRSYGDPDLFYNFWVPPSCNAGSAGGALPTPGSVGAQLYIAPQPVPAYVGHTFFTYQPLMPHEMLYPHSRHYHRYYDEGRGYNRTAVKWYKSPSYTASNILGYFSLAR
jgi:hypothetical protein